jgi:hypothetical protein
MHGDIYGTEWKWPRTRNELVPLQSINGALLQEDLGLVKKQDRFPFCDHFQDVTKRLLDRFRVDAKLRGAH